MRYARSFLEDLVQLDPLQHQEIYDYVLTQMRQIESVYELPGLRPLDPSRIYYRFGLKDYLIGIEATGRIIKLIRILPKPEV
ncbi:MAG: cytotoxic translational repressor of toxin-antitoxin stability system [Oscillatoriales cyanobacterium RM1_1_9]|nr:cytotoxic translational repressor of toxin-antitoxin stability system [Oscillatoriales cyanobacterium SM2_3_0]NJO45561.1 cytotoxic translational repressor of toxin-antitoxin stability system [Oscillatoriales cyanobacterium RM2_1_1]NJO70822.1 cytotoxic translational repressor of toxin-antitoxin stability system [Oscillatoriales cyanobacterium RM1_1_9]